MIMSLASNSGPHTVSPLSLHGWSCPAGQVKWAETQLQNCRELFIRTAHRLLQSCWHSYRLWNIILSVYFFIFFYNKCIQWLGRQVWEKIKDGLVCLKQFQSFVSFLYRWNRTAALNPGRLGGQKIVVTRLPSQSRKLMSLYSKSVLCITILIAHFWSSRAMWFPRLSIWQQHESCWWKEPTGSSNRSRYSVVCQL